MESLLERLKKLFEPRSLVNPLIGLRGLTLPDPGIFITSKAQGGADSAPPSKMRNIAYEILKFCMYVVLVISNLFSDFQLLRVVF